MIIIASVNVKPLLEVFRHFPADSEDSMDKLLEEQVRLLVSSSGNVPGLVQVTPPHSKGKRGNSAKIQGQNAVSNDIYQVYATPGRVWELMKQYQGIKAANGWWRLWKEDPVKAKRFLELSAPSAIQAMSIGFDGGAAHKAARGNNGRVRGKPRVIVLNELGQLRKYIRLRQKNVGLLAASIPAAIGNKYGKLKGVPAWISRHTSSYGYSREAETPKGRTIFLGVSNSAIRDMQRRFTYVLNYRINAIKRQLPFLQRALERKLQKALDSASA